MKSALLTLSLLPAAAFAESDKPVVKVSCIAADQTSGAPLAITDVSLEQVQLDVPVYKSARGYTYTISRTTAGKEDNLQYLLFLSVEKRGRIVAQTGVDIEPGKEFNVMISADPRKETLTCAGK